VDDQQRACLGHFHFLLTSCAGAAAAATSGKLVLSAKGRLVCSWTKALCSKLLLFSCNSPFPFSLPIGCLGILFILHSSGRCFFLLTAIKPSDATISCGLLSNASLQRRVSSSGEFSSVSTKLKLLRLTGLMLCSTPSWMFLSVPNRLAPLKLSGSSTWWMTCSAKPFPISILAKRASSQSTDCLLHSVRLISY